MNTFKVDKNKPFSRPEQTIIFGTAFDQELVLCYGDNIFHKKLID